ncbi:hypothetical protein SPRG_01573 [Saprolegnia parasitica CBS 223.65]|uniref:NECAP PHear domain-containing protein n=1 Tax=Saprolegnia parasitica (strain CBS 223.65) TaxID=695850 RepID=A0A067CV88_SAPPC|nr:hypothetical protein SPRG_01573 [Saprolegnia parasitica CBS 223.65]KDO34438.1 hypothetical protein SPRG_01573 [Saprolegnia parasitica CBS 223.65]|eukprot:XP_012195169.1 hypothetical protein SPRG_01573 [Saprolegnia parasitica CBS 223.65]
MLAAGLAVGGGSWDVAQDGSKLVAWIDGVYRADLSVGSKQKVLHFAMEQTLFQEKAVWVYQIPVLTGDPRADAWDIEKPLLTASLKVLQTNDDCSIQLFEPAVGDNPPVLFAQCPVDIDAERSLTVFVQYCVDSSRYFVLRAVDHASKRNAFIGVGFPERSAAFNFRAALEDFGRYKQRLLVIASNATKETKDLSLPEGATIRVQIGGKTQVSTTPKEPKAPVDLSAIKFAPPPAYNPSAVADDEWGEFTSG